MALPFLGSKAKKREQIVGIDLGAHSAKAVHLQRKGDGFALLGYAVVERTAPASGGREEPADRRLSALMNALGSRVKQVVMAVGASDSVLRPADLPLVPVSDMRTMLKFNSRNYLQQDLSDCVFDCYVLPPRRGAAGDSLKPGQKTRVLVGAVKNGVVEQGLALAQAAGLQAEALVPELICPVNAFEVAHPDVFAGEAVALVDLGFTHSSICLLLEGEPLLNRVVGVGGDKLTTGLAEALGTSYSEAEGIKVGLAHEVQTTFTPLISPLARELRASIDFFEHQHDRTVGRVFVSGAASASAFLLECLQADLMVPCSSWNPVATLRPALPAQQSAGLDQAAVLLSTAIGAAISVL